MRNSLIASAGGAMNGSRKSEFECFARKQALETLAHTGNNAGNAERSAPSSLAGPAGVAAWTLIFGICYFAAVRLGLTLLVQPESVAVFWPASGLAGGALVVLGRSGILPVGLGIILGTVAANLLGDRNLPLATVLGCCNAGEDNGCAIFTFI